MQLMSAFHPDTPPGELIIDRIQRLTKPLYLTDTIPRDTIVQIHFCNQAKYPQQYTNLALYADLFKYTLGTTGSATI